MARREDAPGSVPSQAVAPICFAQPPTRPFGFCLDQPVASRQDPSKAYGTWQDDNNTLSKRRPSSEPELFSANTWSRMWFQRLMVLTLCRLLVFIKKVYEDYQATMSYSSSGQFGHFLVALGTLLMPTFTFTMYRVSRYLQSAVQLRRLTRHRRRPPIGFAGADAADTGAAGRLMANTPTRLAASADQQSDNFDGLVTARQTPNLQEDGQDSKAWLERNSPAPSTALVKDSPHSFASAKQGSVARIHEQLAAAEPQPVGLLAIIMGTGEQLLHGVLYLFWQLKRQVDVIGYLVDRSCLWRKPREEELEQVERLRTSSDGLEWFEDFYAAFLAILVQVYTLGLSWLPHDAHQNHSNSSQIATGPVKAALSSENGLGPDVPVSRAASYLADTADKLNVSNSTAPDLMIWSQLVVSSAVVVSLLIAVRRRDDGPLTLSLSMLGWGSLFAARILVLALGFVHLGWHLMVPGALLHMLIVTCWIYRISMNSHNCKPGESEEFQWNPQDEESAAHDSSSLRQTDGASPVPVARQLNNAQQGTKSWSCVEHLVLFNQIVLLFALPSLFYWPIMFNLKIHSRPFKYLAGVLAQNFILIPSIWYVISVSTKSAGNDQFFLLLIAAVLSITGFLFISLYVCCKPSLTEYFARADELFNEAETAGIYYEFCSRVFRMPDLSDNSFRRLMNQAAIKVESS